MERAEQAQAVTVSRPTSQQEVRAASGAPPIRVFIHGRVEGRARYSGFHRIGAEEGRTKP